MSPKPSIIKSNCNPFDEITSLLQKCKHKDHLHQIHARIVTTGLVHKPSVASKLVASLASIPLPATNSAARSIADGVKGLDSYTWNTIIRGHLAGNQPKEALLVYSHVRGKGLEVDSYTLQFAIKACRLMPLVLEGKQLHNQILKLGFGSEIIIQTSLVNLYGFFGELECMQQVFDETPQRDLVMWNSVVAAYSQHNFPYMALAVASAMAREGLRLNGSSVVSLLSACSFLKAIRKGKEVHGYVIRGQLVDNHDVFVYNALISMYSRCGVLSSARRIFQTMPMKNVVSWTSMINCYSNNDHLKEAFWLFEQMESEKIKPDEITILGVISMSSKFRSFKIAEWIDRYVERNGFRSTGSIAMLNALMDMHAKCGNIKKACEIFDGMEQKSLMSWTTIIHGLAMHSDGKQALAMFSQMQREGCKPDGVVFLNILSACSHAGMVDEARNCFNSMVNDYHMKPQMEHCGCMVDLLCRAGLVSEAFEFVQTMPDKPDTMIWRMLLGACQGQGDGSLARRILSQLREIGPKNSRDYGLLSNLYAAMDEWDNVKEIRREMKEKGVIKEDPGSSSIEVY
ncbi:hypothetical protein FF2_015276 [Malus domestica]